MARLCSGRDGDSTFLPWKPTQDPCVAAPCPPRPQGPAPAPSPRKPEGKVIRSTLVHGVPGAWLLLFLPLRLSPHLRAQSSPVNRGPDTSKRKLEK